jgi:hypothetical protein
LPGGTDNYGPSPFAATTIAANLSVVGLTRGFGVGTSYTAAAGGWGGMGFIGLNADSAIASDQFAFFTITPDIGYKVSFSSIPSFDYYRSPTGPPNGLMQFSVGASNFIDITTLGYPVASSGAPIGAIDLSGIAALQDVSTKVTFRIVNYGGGSRGTWYIYKTVLALQGVVTLDPSYSNSPPTLAAIADQTIAVGMHLVVTNHATDPDSPPEVLTYSLSSGAATNASISPASGLFQWTPTPAQVGTNAFNVVVTDNGLPPLNATQSFSVVVVPSNSPPVLAAIPNQTVVVGMNLVVTNIATDPDSPPQKLTFTLGNGSATNASIDPITGIFSWTPAQTQVGTNVFTVAVTDNGLPPLSAAQSFEVVVVPSNNPPVLAAITNRTIAVGMNLVITNVATDPDTRRKS